jgi:tetratricopeptide (TPR) repeat protein
MASRYNSHCLWLIKHAPEIATAPGVALRIDRKLDQASYEQGKALWRDHITRQPENVILLESAAKYLDCHDHDNAIALLKRAITLQPENARLHRVLGKLLLRLYTVGRMVQSTRVAHEPYLELQEAYRLSQGTRDEWAVFPELCYAALFMGENESAECYAMQMLRRDPSGPSVPDANELKHHAHTVLGILAIRVGDERLACDHLLASATISRTPVLSSFGPEMDLAAELLIRGHKQAIIEFLKLCSSWWHTDDHRAERWIQEIERGCWPTDIVRMPMR